MTTIYSAAIYQLERSSRVIENNAKLYAQEGDLKDASEARKRAKSYRAAIKALKSL